MNLHGNQKLKRLDRWLGPLPLLVWGSLKHQGRIPRRIERLLIINISVLGDSLLILPILKSLKHYHPSLKIDLVCAPENQSVYRYHSAIDRLLCFRPGQWFQRWTKWGNPGYDLVIDTGQWIRLSALLAMTYPLSRRVGFSTYDQHRHWGYHRTVSHHQGEWEFYQYLKLFKELEIPEIVGAPYLEYPQDAVQHEIIEQLKEARENGRKLILLHPGAGNEAKAWPFYGELLTSGPELKNCAFVFTGSKGEGPKIDANNDRVYDLRGKTNLYTLDQVIGLSDLVVCGNTGPLYLAAFREKKTLTLPGPVSSTQWFWPNPHETVIPVECSHAPCVFLGFEYLCSECSALKRITAVKIKQVITEILNNSATH